METISKVNFANSLKVSKAAITQAANKGKIKLSEGGAVWVDHEITQAYLAKHKARSSPKPKAPKLPKPKAPKLPKPKAPKLPKPKVPKLPKPSVPTVEAPTGEPGGISLKDITVENLHTFNKEQVDKGKVFESLLKIRQDREVKQGTLIPRSLVELTFARLYSVDANELKVLGDRLTPAICGVFGVADESEEALKIRKMLEDEIAGTLRHIKRILGRFLTEEKNAE